jgi:hypothetical protein
VKHVLKWSVPVDDKDHPIGGGKVVLVACQSSADVVQVWTEEWVGVDPLVRRARVYGTGQPVPVHDEHVGSALTASGHLVWHVFGGRPRPGKGD